MLIFSPFTIHKAKHLGARTVKRVGVDIDAIDVLGEGVEPEAAGQPVGEIVGAELRVREVTKWKAGVADGVDAAAKLSRLAGGERIAILTSQK